ncbi:5'-methylthioadenosine/adenosylhomocysteine nucleosidase [Bacillus sp. FJAT-27916]|uniref:5'-methylthioadenosine/adenosylhomocysteine nucleosidase n=1 Tax=Bacillus sp. FJAT-27916 TaxID=1679169 RepID=UPI0009E22C92|nr:5'-methylthioadenosine/adenosylhomocysteine nucleosidase [Bacillus sp. FJAT-27916]
MKKTLAVILSSFVLMAGCSGNNEGNQAEEVKPIGIIGAMDSEVTSLQSELANAEVKEIAGLEFHTGELNDRDVVIVKSGVGKVNAALCAQILIDEFNVDTLINTGVAGGLYSELEVGDIVVSNQAVQHDMDITAFGHEKGYISDMSEDGKATYFQTDKELAEKTQAIANEVMKDNKAYIGTIASGDIFVSDQALKEELIESFDAYAAEMEGAAIAHVASVNQIPVTIIRAISDLANGEADVTYEEFETKAAENSAEIVRNLVKGL